MCMGIQISVKWQFIIIVTCLSFVLTERARPSFTQDITKLGYQTTWDLLKGIIINFYVGYGLHSCFFFGIIMLGMLQPIIPPPWVLFTFKRQ